MILVVAPYNGALPENTPFLAGAKKIRSIIKALHEVDTPLVLLNSGHQVAANRGAIVNQIDLDGQGLIDVFTPPTRGNFYWGRLSNIINAPEITDDVVARYGIPNVAWFYNGHAFEMRVAIYLKKRYGTKTLLEFEDWHFARNRGFNPKPYLDWIFWRLAVNEFDGGFAVNSKLASVLDYFNVPNTLLPGIVSSSISEISFCSPPFKSEKITIGYFGGLSEEKGAAVILRLAKALGENFNFIITGSGELESEFKALENSRPNTFRFLGAVSDSVLASSISQVDLILNAHQVNDGVFPFKIIEALASGRLLISTLLPMRGYECFSNAIHFYDGNESSLIDIMINSRTIYSRKREYILAAAEFTKRQYGMPALVAKLRKAVVSPCRSSRPV